MMTLEEAVKRTIASQAKAAKAIEDDFEREERLAIQGEKVNGKTVPEAEIVTKRLSSAQVFAPLPAHPWLCKSLQIGPGRPGCFAGYSFGGKTIVVQALALAMATGRTAWGNFSCGKPSRVWHVDQEQGSSTLARYQRLARGIGIEGDEMKDLVARSALEVSIFPHLYMSTTSESLWCKAIDGFDVVILDALRGMLPGVEENSSEMHTHIAKLTSISEKTGTSFLVIHHAGKAPVHDRDERELLRGSSGIFAALGAIWAVFGGRDAPKLIRHLKSHPDATGGLHDDFELAIEDVPNVRDDGSDDPHWGLHVGWRSRSADGSEDPASDALRNAMMAKVLDVVASMPGCSGNYIRGKLKGRGVDKSFAIEALAMAGQIANIGTKAKPLWTVSQAGHDGTQSESSS